MWISDFYVKPLYILIAVAIIIFIIILKIATSFIFKLISLIFLIAVVFSANGYIKSKNITEFAQTFYDKYKDTISIDKIKSLFNTGDIFEKDDEIQIRLNGKLYPLEEVKKTFYSRDGKHYTVVNNEEIEIKCSKSCKFNKGPKEMMKKHETLDLGTNIEGIFENIDISKDVPFLEPNRQYYFIKKLRDIVDQISQEENRKLTACITTFGCQMNERDSEKLTAILKLVGYEIVENEDADFVIFNTCTVRENANLKVYGHLGRISHYKKKNPLMKVGLCGCMMQEDAVVENIKKNYRYVNLIFGTHNIFKFAELLYTCLTNKSMIIDVWKGTDDIIEDIPSDRKYPFKAGINIMFGCDKYCSYCIVPYVRGKERSRACDDIVKEVSALAADGVKEIMLLGQNVNSYGRKRSDKINFANLLREIEKIEGIDRIRFMTPHPRDFDDETIMAMKESRKICKQLHMPLQSGSDAILKAMRRGYTKEKYLNLIKKIKKEIPDIEFSTDIIVGFPGETEEDFLDTMDVVDKVRYNAAYTFIYSKRSGTPAAKLENQIPKDVVNNRYQRLHNLVRKISAEIVDAKVGQIHEVLVEENKDDELNLSGRMSDNTIVHFSGGSRLVGEIVNVELIEACGFYFKGRLI